MRYLYCTLSLALGVLVGCGTPDTQTTSVQTATATAPATTSPPTPSPTATFIPTTAPATPTTIPPTAVPQLAQAAQYVVRSRDDQLIAVAADGSTRQIEIEGLNHAHAIISADGTWIAGPVVGEMPPDRPGPNKGLILYNQTSGAQQTIADGTYISGIRFSPDSRYLLLVTQSYEPTASQIMIHDLATGNQQSVSQPGDVQAYQMHFSPDSRELIFATLSWSEMIWQLNVLSLSSGQQRTLLQGKESLGYIPSAWLPQGILAYTYLVFGADGGPESLFLIDPADASLRTLNDQGYITEATSPDGEQIGIVTGEHGLGIEDPSFTLTLQDLASNERRLIEPESRGGGYVVGWSPDSRMLLYRQPRREGQSFAITGPTFAEPKLLPLDFVPGTISRIVWRDSQTLLILAEEPERDTLYVLPIATPDASHLKRVVSLPAPPKFGYSAIVYIARQ